jgi:hypothetical protein
MSDHDGLRGHRTPGVRQRHDPRRHAPDPAPARSDAAAPAAARPRRLPGKGPPGGRPRRASCSPSSARKNPRRPPPTSAADGHDGCSRPSRGRTRRWWPSRP